MAPSIMAHPAPARVRPELLASSQEAAGPEPPPTSDWVRP
jgi:hypothetical protein